MSKDSFNKISLMFSIVLGIIFISMSLLVRIGVDGEFMSFLTFQAIIGAVPIAILTSLVEEKIGLFAIPAFFLPATFIYIMLLITPLTGV
mgnify:CR=1 FL=1